MSAILDAQHQSLDLQAVLYEQGLDRLCQLSSELIKRGQSYHVVVACHELFRFLYPEDRFAKFCHDQPVPFMVHKIEQLNFWLESCANSLEPYPPATDKALSIDDLEKQTSDFYSELWKDFDLPKMIEEAQNLIEQRLSASKVQSAVAGKTVLDMGCGSGRYSLALSGLGAQSVSAVDYQQKSFAAIKPYAQGKAIEFFEGNVLKLPFDNEQFDFVFCNGVLHHSASIEQGLGELSRVLKGGGHAFIYLYGSGGFFWNTRKRMRELFKRIPRTLCHAVFKAMNVPAARFVFCDTWYVPVETHSSREELETLFDKLGLGFEKLESQGPFDLEPAIDLFGYEGQLVWGQGEHRYFLSKA